MPHGRSPPSIHLVPFLLPPPLLLLFFHLITLFLLRVDYARADPGALLEHILEHYDKRIRPYAGYEENGEEKPVVVEMTIVLAILTELKWRDPSLEWDPRQFNNIRHIVVPQSLVWVPKLFIYNSIDTKEMLSVSHYDVRVLYDGHVRINIPQYVTCTCRLSIDRFPFDTQFCSIALASPLLNTSEMDVNSTQPPNDSYFAGNAEWEVTNVTVRHMRFAEDGEYRAEVHYIMHLHRRPVYYITVIVAPTFLISALSILGIFSPGSNDGPRSEKVSLGLGSLLAMTVLLDIVAAAMPKSNSIPLLGYYIIAVIVLNAGGIGISMGVLALSRHIVQKSRLPSVRLYHAMWMRPKRPKEQRREFSIFPRSSAYALDPQTGMEIKLDEVEVGSEKLRHNGRSPTMNTPNIVVGVGNNNGDIGGKMWERRNSPAHLAPPMAAHMGGGKRRVSILSGNEESLERAKLPESAELLAVYNKLMEITKTQILFKRRLEKRKWKNLVEREWNRLFSRFDYLFLVLFEGLNVLVLLMFLRFSWLPMPELPADFAV